MWRSVWLPLGLLAGLALAIACGSSKSETESVCRIDPTSVAGQTGGPLPTVSLQEAQTLVDFEIAFPATLPPGVTANTVVMRRDPVCPRRHPIIEVVVEGDDYGFTIMESVGDAMIGGPTETIRINGVDGQVEKGSPQPGLTRMSVGWKRGGLSFIATAFLYGDLTEEIFLDILESIP